MKTALFPQHPHLKGALTAFTGFSLFAMGDAVFKYLSPYYPVFVLAFIASCFAFVTLIVMALKKGPLSQTLKTDYLRLHLLRGVFLLCQFLCLIYALGQLSMAKTYALFFIAPFLTALLAIPVLKEKMPWQKALIICFGFAGVLLILRPGLIAVELATILALGSALFLAGANIAARLIGDNGSPLAFGIYVEFVVVPLTAILAFLNFVMPTMPHFFLLAFAGITGAFALVLVAQSFVWAPAAIAAPFQYVQILWGIVLGYLIFADQPDIWVLGGAFMIVLSGFALVRRP